MGASVKVVDFSNVKDGGQFNKARIPAGDYLAKVIKVEDAQTKETKEFQYLFTIQIQKRPSSKFPYYCKLTENQLWKLRNLLIAAGLNVPKKREKVDPNRVVGKIIGVTVDDTEYEDKEQSEITGVFPASELQDSVMNDDDDDEMADDVDDADDELEDLDEASDEEDEEEPAEEDEEVDEGDEWDAITDRLELRKALKKVAPDVKTTTAMTEDDIRDLIRKAYADKAAAEKPKAKATSKVKKKAKEVSDDELESLDLDDL